HTTVRSWAACWAYRTLHSTPCSATALSNAEERRMSSHNTQTLVIQHGALIDGAGRPAVANEAIVIEGNRIRSIGRLPADIRVEDQDTVHVIDATGQWIMPGLIDGHCHLSFGMPQMGPVASARGTTNPGFTALRAALNAQQVLRSGVTSIAVPGGTWFIDVA